MITEHWRMSIMAQNNEFSLYKPGSGNVSLRNWSWNCSGNSGTRSVATAFEGNCSIQLPHSATKVTIFPATLG